jgi:hypothetical protein
MTDTDIQKIRAMLLSPDSFSREARERMSNVLQAHWESMQRLNKAGNR